MSLRQRQPLRHIRPNESPENLVGERFGSMVVIDLAEARHKRTYWRVRCDCGKEMDKRWSSIRDGVRCGGCTPTVHGHARRGENRSSEYNIWHSMRDRCLRPNNRAFRHYGGRGISVCDRWVNDFENFYADMGPRPSEGHSIDRINNDGNYEPSNCRWATRVEQANNKRRGDAI